MLLQQDLVGIQKQIFGLPWNRGLWPLLNDVETVYTGEATYIPWLEPNSRRKDDTLRQVQPNSVLTIPEDVADPGNIPVVLFGHGINTSAELAYGVANFVMVMPSLPSTLPWHAVRMHLRRPMRGLGLFCRGDGQYQ